jgi:glycosyltransferase involved in cell wall biosynthesis
MKALFLIQGFDVPSARYRVLQFLPAWDEAGFEKEVLTHSEALKNEKRTLEIAKDCDVVFLHRKRLSPSFVKKLKRAAKRLVYDVDDAVMFNDAKHRKSQSFTRQWRYKRLVRAVDEVIVGNSYIAEHTPVKSQVLPTCIQMKHYEAASNIPEATEPTLVWIGDTGSLHYLKQLVPVLERLGQDIEGLRLKIICDTFLKIKNIEVIEVPWSAETEVAELADSQLGLMPLGLDAWSKGKCALKFLQYLAVGRPAVVTPVGMNEDLLKLGACGLPASTDEEWFQALKKLLSDKELRIKQGLLGRRLVEEHFSLKARSDEWLSLVSGRNLTKGGRGAAARDSEKE